MDPGRGDIAQWTLENTSSFAWEQSMSAIEAPSIKNDDRLNPLPCRAVPNPVQEKAAGAGKSNTALIVLAVLGPIALFVAWRVFTLGMADLWVDAKPDRAAYWRAGNPDALYGETDDAFTKLKLPQTRALALRSIANYPLDGRGYRELAGIADFLSNHVEAKRLFELAVRYAPRDTSARLSLIDQDLKGGDAAGALSHVDMALRLEPDIMPDLLPRLGAVAGTPGVLGALSKMLDTYPPWRVYFLANMADQALDSDAIDRVFASRSRDEHLPLNPPEADDTSGEMELSPDYTETDLLINRQVRDQRWDTAYVTWINTLSEAQRAVLGNIYDGGFAFQPTSDRIPWLIPAGKSFGWIISPGTGYDVLIAPRTRFDNDNILQVTFNGLPLDYLPIKQLLVLPTGHYRLTGMGDAGAMTSEGGFQWVVTCAALPTDITADRKNQELGRSMMFSGNIAWSSFQMEFDVPAKPECGGQYLSLELAGEVFEGQPIEGAARFDNMAVVRTGDAVAPAQQLQLKLATPKPAAQKPAFGVLH
jgi:tetratricopeptide (TPR) repeat protein